MKEFSRIFRTDPVSEKLNKLISEELDMQEKLKETQQKQAWLGLDDGRCDGCEPGLAR
jgi:hypothetical protein